MTQLSNNLKIENWKLKILKIAVIAKLQKTKKIKVKLINNQ